MHQGTTPSAPLASRSVVHANWNPIPRRLEDYIALPKARVERAPDRLHGCMGSNRVLPRSSKLHGLSTTASIRYGGLRAAIAGTIA
jgi:hypothetical protein